MPSALRVRATVATYILDAPARSSTRAHSETVVPVVNTSSTRRTAPPVTKLGACDDDRPADIFAPLMPGGSGLRLGFAMPF